MAKTIAQLEQDVANLEQPLLDAKGTHEEAQSTAQAAIQGAARTRDNLCQEHITSYLVQKENALAAAEPAALAYAEKRAEFQVAILARNSARKELQQGASS